MPRRLPAFVCSREDFGSARPVNARHRPNSFYFFVMAATAIPEVIPDVRREEDTTPRSARDPGYLVICWNDPINYMEYVTHVFQVVFGWTRQKAEFHMRQVHEQNKSVLVRESLEKAEHYVHQLQKYSLHATMERDE
jgi:ATP-dependent Clp protease adaptor protein ClpS